MFQAIVRTTVLALLPFFTTTATAQTFTVCPTGCDYDTIQGAIDGVPDNATIEIAAGTYVLGSALDPQGKAVIIRGTIDESGALVTILDGGGSNRVLQCVSGEDLDTIFENLVIQNGSASGLDPDNNGGGMYNLASSPTLINCTFRNNTAEYKGGGMCNADYSSPTLTNCTFTGNTSYYGAGMHSERSTSQITGCIFTDNYADTYGGGMRFVEGAPDLYDCRFIGNSGGDGAGVYMEDGTQGTVINCEFRSNEARGVGDGGGLKAYDGASPDVVNCVFTENVAGKGGGLYAYYATSMVVRNCVFQNNVATRPEQEGLGAAIFAESNGYAEFVQMTLAGTIVCGSSPDLIFGPYIDGGGNCLMGTCSDTDGDDVADGCPEGPGIILEVPSDAFPTIESAILAARSSDIIEIAEGDYFPAATLNPLGLSITIRGAVDDEGTPTTVIHGTGSERVIQCTSNEGPDTVFQNLVIRDGTHDYYGAGMWIKWASPKLENCTFTNNTSSDIGGGMYVGWGSPVLIGCLFHENEADEGGGLYAGFMSSPKLTGCRFTNNSSVSDGGGMFCGTSNPILEGCEFFANAARNGGGLYVNNDGNLVLEECLFQDNFAEGVGGGMFTAGSSTHVSRCRFELNNSAGSSGGGGIASQGPDPMLEDTILCGNNPDQYLGSYTDAGGNCLATLCDSSTKDGRPDDCNESQNIIISVPSLTHPTISSAIAGAPEGAIIEIAEGTYVPEATLDTQGKAITLLGATDESGHPTTIIDGGDTIRVLQCVNGEGPDTVFRNLFITRGRTTWGVDGAGMLNLGSSPALENCIFDGNTSQQYGGGMANVESSPTVANCTFVSNMALGSGGGMDNRTSSNPMVIDCTFTGNTTGIGGGMGNFESSPTVVNCTFTNNVGELSGIPNIPAGGGMYIYGSAGSSYPVVRSCDFIDNAGCGIIHQSGTMVLTDTILCGNTSIPSLPFGQYHGAGSYIDGGGNCLATSCADNTGDGYPDSCGTPPTGTMFVPSAAYPTIASAITASFDGDVIVIAAGSHPIEDTLNTQGKAITLQGVTDETGYPTTILDGQESDGVMECVNGEGSDTVFKDLLITNGRRNRGGGLYCESSSPTLLNCVFQGNGGSTSSGAYGGGMYCKAGNPTLTSCAFIENSVSALYGNATGGGLYCFESSPVLDACRFEGNTANRGGGMACFGGSPVVQDCTFQLNSSWDGGGMYCGYDASAIVNDCVFTGNDAERGAGLYATASSLDLSRTSFEGNTALDHGGGIYTLTSETALDDCTFVNNSCVSNGGGMSNSFSTVFLDECTFTGNTAASAGAIFDGDPTDPTTFINSTLCDNGPDQIWGGYTDDGGNCISEVCTDTDRDGLPDCGAPCVGDINGDGEVDGADLAYVLGYWGTDEALPDLDDDGLVDAADLGLVVAAWGSCP